MKNKRGYYFALYFSLKNLTFFLPFSNAAFFEFQSFGTSIVRLRNLVTGRFLAINSNGRVVTQVRFSVLFFSIVIVTQLTSVYVLALRGSFEFVEQ